MGFGSAGEQRNRKYDWEKAGIDPAEFKFGVTHAEDYVDGVAKALNPTKEEDYQESVSIVPERLERFKLTAKDELGKCRSMGWGNRNIPDGFADLMQNDFINDMDNTITSLDISSDNIDYFAHVRNLNTSCIGFYEIYYFTT